MVISFFFFVHTFRSFWLSLCSVAVGEETANEPGSRRTSKFLSFAGLCPIFQQVMCPRPNYILHAVEGLSRKTTAP